MTRSATILAAALLLGACSTPTPSPVASDLLAASLSPASTAPVALSPTAVPAPSALIGAGIPTAFR
jgi:hypothetical protein